MKDQKNVLFENLQQIVRTKMQNKQIKHPLASTNPFYLALSKKLTIET